MQAGELAADVTLVEAKRLGDTSLNEGRRPIPGAELARTFDGLRDLTRLPASVAVIGGADTGCQLASILDDFGAQVTLLEASPRSRSARTARLVQTPSSASSRPDRIALTNAS